MNLFRIHLVAGALVAGASVVAGAGVVARLARGRKTPEQRERLRRERITAQGRITEGRLLDLRELETGNGRPRQTILYSYQVSGVHYECAQEVTQLRPLFDPRLFDPMCFHNGVTASVRYDPRHPGDSIVVAESWCGLRV